MDPFEPPKHLPKARSRNTRLMLALWTLQATNPERALRRSTLLDHLGLAPQSDPVWRQSFTRHSLRSGWIAHSANNMLYLTPDGVDILKALHYYGRIDLPSYTSPSTPLPELPVAHPPAVPESIIAPSTTTAPAPAPQQAAWVRSRSFGHVAGGAAHLPAPVRADGLVHRGLPSRRGNLLVYRDGSTEPVPGTAPQPTTHQRPQRAWDLEQIAQAQATPATSHKQAA